MRVLRIALPMALCLVLSGCWDIIPVEELGFVNLLIVDQTPQGVRTIAQLETAGSFSPKGHEMPEVVEATGKSFFDSMRILTIKSARKPFLGALQGIVVSDRAAAGPTLGDIVDYLLRDSRAPGTSWLWLIPSTQIDALAHMQVLAAQATGRAIAAQSRLATLFSDVKPMRVQEFARSAWTIGTAAVVPVLAVKGAQVIFDKVAIFENGVLVGQVQGSALAGLPWLVQTPPTETEASIEVGKTFMGIVYKGRYLKIIPMIQNGALKRMTLQLKTNIMVANVSKGGVRTLTPKNITLIESAAAQQVLNDY